MYRLVLLVCLSISLSKNSSSCCAIGFESGCKGKGFNFNHQMFSKVFLKLFFQGGRLYVPKGLIRSRSLSHAKVRYRVQILIKESNAPTFVSPSQSHCFVSAASLPIAVAKVDGFNLTAKHILRFFLNFFETSL